MVDSVDPTVPAVAARIVEIQRAARRGHGRQLVQSVPDDRLTVVSTGVDNVPARSLYETMGFEQTGETEIAPGVLLVQLARS